MINPDRILEFKETGSTKDYWRQKYGIIDKIKSEL